MCVHPRPSYRRITTPSNNNTTKHTNQTHNQRDPSAPVLISKARVARALLERLATLPPSFDGRARRVRCFRWLAHCLGPVPATSDEER